MIAAGIICEYNPFHKGHKYHIEKTREITGADTVIAIMSGNYVQRGDIAVFDKQVRSKAAVLNGIDLVIELPAIMSLCTAERFALSSVEILNALGHVKFISFGAENDNINILWEIARLLCSEPPAFKDSLAVGLKNGNSYAAARCKAVEYYIPNAHEIMSSPNNILAIEYLKAIIKTESSLSPVSVKRLGGGYNSTDLGCGFISATAARKLINCGNDLSGYVPDNVLPLYKNAKIHSLSNMSSAVIANLCKMSPEEILEISDVSEGLENKIKKEAQRSNTFDELCDNIKSKRYAHSRIRRILLHSFLGIKKEDLIAPLYIKVLDFNENGQNFLNKIKQETSLPLVKNFNQIKTIKNPKAEKMWKKELVYDRIYDLF